MVAVEDPQANAGDIERGLTEPGLPRLTAARSPYRRKLGGGESTGQTTVSLVVHLIAWLLAVAWFVVELARESSDRTVPATLLVGSAFLVVAPVVVATWERKFRRFEDELRADRSLGDDAWNHLGEALGWVSAFRHAIVAAPVIFITVAYLAGDSFFADRLNVPESGVEFVIGLLILQLGSLAAGWGTYGAVVTIVVAIVTAKHQADFAPYAGTPSRACRALGTFCFSTALLYGAAGALVVPGLCAAIWVADGVAQVALAATVLMVLVTTGALLAIPATVLSRRGEDDRVAYLDRLSSQIDELGRAATDPTTQFDDTQYVRLRALLEMRTHVVGHRVENSSIEMVKRIPVAVLLPTASVVASWWTLVAS